MTPIDKILSDLSEVDFLAFHARLSAKLSASGCFHDHRFTRSILLKMQIHPGLALAIINYLNNHHAQCDCTARLKIGRTLNRLAASRLASNPVPPPTIFDGMSFGQRRF
jgi:hypothetical protein